MNNRGNKATCPIEQVSCEAFFLFAWTTDCSDSVVYPILGLDYSRSWLECLLKVQVEAGTTSCAGTALRWSPNRVVYESVRMKPRPGPRRSVLSVVRRFTSLRRVPLLYCLHSGPRSSHHHARALTIAAPVFMSAKPLLTVSDASTNTTFDRFSC